MKTILADTYAYQRLPHDEIINQALENLKDDDGRQIPFPYAVPAYVPVIYNNVFGDQKCKAVAGFPAGIEARQNGGSCPASPDASSPGDSTGTIFFSTQPTYVSSGWSGFSTVSAVASESNSYSFQTISPSSTPAQSSSTTTQVL